MTLEEFQASRKEIADLGAYQGIPAQNGVRAFTYAKSRLIEVRPDWLDGGDEFIVTASDLDNPAFDRSGYPIMKEQSFKSLEEAERFLHNWIVRAW